VLSLLRESLSEPLRSVFHLREHNDESILVILKPVRKHLRLCLCCNLIERVRNRGLSILHLNPDDLWIILNATRKLLNLRRHRRREEHRLTLARYLGDDLFDLWKESHVKHSIGFVEDQRFDTREIHRATT
jgi:hypothetical protein